MKENDLDLKTGFAVLGCSKKVDIIVMYTLLQALL